MGRLRNLSSSFKAAAFPSASSVNNNYSRASPESQNSTQAEKDTPAGIVGERSSNPLLGANSNRNSTIYTPPTITSQANEEIEELKPVFSYLSSHANKLYQEGYFLKLDDLDTHGKPNPNRVWTECFAQLVGTILSFWNAEALDAAGQDGEVAPSFINLADASIKMIETLPTRNQGVQPLQNVLSISTAGKNRYLLHFNSLHSLTQWTAGIRLAMFENASLHELYTGSLIAGKGRHLNSINQIMTKNRFRIEDWARVRFGAGTPWRRCWCVIEPPDEKEWQKSQKKLGKRSAYDRPVYPKGDIKFYDSKKIKKATPIATITDAYSAYAIYPQSKFLINESTLVKLEGKITIHSQPESKTEGFVFVMPEVHPAVSGFEMMLRWLLPVYDTFSLYGRPTRLIPDTLDPKSLMFAMPKERRYGYLDIIDIAALIHTEGSDQWTEREWRKKMKEAVVRRMSMQVAGRASNVEKFRNAANPRQGIHFSDGASVYSERSGHRRNESSDAVFETPKKTFTAPAQLAHNYHSRSASENIELSPHKLHEPTSQEYRPSRLSPEQNMPDHLDAPTMPHIRQPLRPRVNEAGYMDSANSSDSEMHNPIYAEDVERDMIQQKPVQPVVAPPDFQHAANDQPRKRPVDRPEMRREKSRMSDATLAQMNPKLLDQLRREGEIREAGGANGASSMASSAASAAAYAWAGVPAQSGNRLDQQFGDQQGMPNMQGRGVTETPTKMSGSFTNTQRAAVVGNNASSTSTHTQTSIQQDNIAVDSHQLRVDQNLLVTSDHSMPFYDRESSPDYDSHQEDLPKPKEKVRGGTRKVVGDAETQTAIPEPLSVDFGQTLRLTPENSRPNTAAGHRSLFEQGSSGRRSPFDSLGQPSPSAQPSRPFAPVSPARTPEKQSPLERPSHSRSQSYAWRPRGQVEAAGGLSAEDFVSQRATIAMQPQGYVIHRPLSSGRVEQIKLDQAPRPQTPASPSPRRLQKRSSSRQSSGTSIDYSAHLSAREQEMVAKMTGGPLLSNINQKSRTPDPSVGLIGAIEARDQEKENIKKGLQGKMLQAAIDQRHRESRASQILQTEQFHRRQSRYMAQAQQQQQYQNVNPYQYPIQQSQPAHQNYWDVTVPQPQNTQAYQQSLYNMQQQQAMQRAATSEVPDHMTQAGYPARPNHQRTQSSYSQYGGFYVPQR